MSDYHACPRCGSTDPAELCWFTNGTGGCSEDRRDDWHDRPSDHCPRCGSNDPAVREVDDILRPCGHDWHAA